MNGRPASPLLEFDPDRAAVVDPFDLARRKGRKLPARAVLCFFSDVIAAREARGDFRPVSRLTSEMGVHPVHGLAAGRKTVAVFQPGIGAPLSAGFLDEMVGAGVRKVIVCGGSGVVVPGIPAATILLPTAAICDEGTSHHYLPPGREVAQNPKALAALRRVLAGRGLAWREGKTWTTDGLFRETRGKIAARAAEGALCVEMEAAALFAVAEHRGIALGQVVYAGDDVSGPEWDPRGWNRIRPIRETLFDVAVEACCLL